MGGLQPLPSATWLLGAAGHHAEQARLLLTLAGTGDWRGHAATAYAYRLSSLARAVTALADELATAGWSAGAHENELRVVQAQYGQAR
ncbi:hypothetical protein [Pseudactinotalea sp. Z1732]|uniref:hypothetical protein n=1 Tax=Pseudactinotalea sp. Z1732 TaxID=3413026 RepID=UPI003C7AF71A